MGIIIHAKISNRGLQFDQQINKSKIRHKKYIVKKMVTVHASLFPGLTGSNSRKWNSKQLNNGVLTGKFILPEFPKVIIAWKS